VYCFLEVGFDGDDTTTNPVEKYYYNDITSMKFFINAVNTITKGVDVVYKI
jgi:iron complex outermembrane receptor protein